MKRIKVSKFLSGLLRHFPEKYGLKVDPYGWVDLESVAEVVAKRYGLTKSQALKLIKELEKTDAKKRFEIKEGRIRARYGHSIKVETKWSEEGEIPTVLYHGTSRSSLNSILKEGLLPIKRREVHLSKSVKDAIEVGKRHDKNPVVLKIRADEMIKEGYQIRKKGEVFTADFVPPKYIEVVSNITEDSKGDSTQKAGKKGVS